jgi:hypothetical protein
MASVSGNDTAMEELDKLDHSSIKYWWYIIEEEDHALPRPHLRLKYAVAIRDGFFTLFRDQALGV